ncbi:alpha/beta hydrolase [Chitinophaga caseinilytica]|uniref:alpha/beta hydrolase n=1 Tax=Chitinophaga caseinilytica TaxID=2267521 RepID=UPI003C2E6430
MHTENIVTAGKPLSEATKALIMVHGRGGSAEDILSLAAHLSVKDFVLLAPQATNNTWYPQSFLAPPAQNEPWLSAAIDQLKHITDHLERRGIAQENTYFLGFSQGACLTLEFLARNGARYGGAVAFTGGLIGDTIDKSNYNGNFGGTPIFIGSSNPDFHVPVERVQASTAILREMGATVTEKIYDNMGHTISGDEIKLANSLIFS